MVNIFISDDDKRSVQHYAWVVNSPGCVCVCDHIQAHCTCITQTNTDKRQLLLLQSNNKLFVLFVILVCSRCDSLYRQGDAVERFSKFFPHSDCRAICHDSSTISTQANQTTKRKIGLIKQIYNQTEF